MLRFLRCAAQGGAGLPRFAMGATPERRTARRVAARLVARYNKPIPLRGPLGLRSGGPSKASRRSSQIVNRFLGVWSSLNACSRSSLTPPSAQRPFTAFVVLGEEGAQTARALTEELQCPFIELDGVS